MKSTHDQAKSISSHHITFLCSPWLNGVQIHTILLVPMQWVTGSKKKKKRILIFNFKHISRNQSYQLPILLAWPYQICGPDQEWVAGPNKILDMVIHLYLNQKKKAKPHVNMIFVTKL